MDVQAARSLAGRESIHVISQPEKARIQNGHRHDTPHTAGSAWVGPHRRGELAGQSRVRAKVTATDSRTRGGMDYHGMKVILSQGIVAGHADDESSRRTGRTGGLRPCGEPRVGDARGVVVAAREGGVGAHVRTRPGVDVQPARRAARREALQRVRHFEQTRVHRDFEKPTDAARSAWILADSRREASVILEKSATHSGPPCTVRDHGMQLVVGKGVVTTRAHRERARGCGRAGGLRPRCEPRIGVPSGEVVPPWEGRVGADTFARA
mmetsp:Transcript_33914/g.77061  ORF Transcript_33914/g.77061 Transcript_33914/m.77061 type:complete len:267 (+) Transcript_33914:866-1666(+)